MRKWQWTVIIAGCAAAIIGMVTQTMAQSVTVPGIGAAHSEVTADTRFAWPVVVALVTLAVGAGAVAAGLRFVGERVGRMEQTVNGAMTRVECQTVHRERSDELQGLEARLVENIKLNVEAMVRRLLAERGN